LENTAGLVISLGRVDDVEVGVPSIGFVQVIADDTGKGSQ